MSMPSRSRTGSGALVAVLISVVSTVAVIAILWAAGATPQSVWNSFFPVDGVTPATEQSQSTRQLYNVVFYIAVAIFVIVEALIVWSVFRYRRKPGEDQLPPQTHGNNLVEVIWTAIPTVIVLLLFVLSFQTLQTVDAKSGTDIRIRAVAARFQWSFDYLGKDGEVLFTQALPIGEGGGMVVPVGEPVHVILRSPDVNHAFYVPKFLFKRDAIPGQDNNFDFTVEEPGTYRGQCAELCGTYHGSMVFEVHAVDRAEFDAWVKTQTDKANATQAPQPSGEAVGTVVELAAKNVQFSTNALSAPADQPFTIHFKNDDASVVHNVEIKDASGAQVFMGELITGPGEANYQVPALAAGEYTFICTVHPNMTGTLTVQ